MIRVALAQLNLTVGDVDGNASRLIEAIERAQGAGAQVLAPPELGIPGYPPEDLVHKRSFVEANRTALEKVAAATGELAAVIGFVDFDEDGLYNAAALCVGGGVVAVYRKQLLPNYGVFDERRYFIPGDRHILFETSYGVLGLCVCEDAWSATGPAVSQGDAGAQVVLNINASPFHEDKWSERAAMLGDRARRARASIVYVNMVGGQDEVVFDGGSMVVAPDGTVLARMPQFEEAFSIIDVPLGEARDSHSETVDYLPLDLPQPSGVAEFPRAPELDDPEEVYRALTLSLRDYVTKNGFQKVVMGLSGGIDSSLVATIAADALGAGNVLGVAMPSEFSSEHSLTDARALASNLGVEFVEVPIKDLHNPFVAALRDAFGDAPFGLAEENLQARVRGNLLMAISNRFGHLVVTTGNKSELACGYSTLYGDMAGGFSLLKDVFKTQVYELSRWRNQESEVIPTSVLEKPPSAELRPGQKDSDSLPSYDALDPILIGYVEKDMGLEDLVYEGHERAVVEGVIALVDRAEYKRRQAPPGPKVTVKAFGRDRRLPITNRWREDHG